MPTIDVIALVVFGLSWIGFSWLTGPGGTRFLGRRSLNQLIAEQRRRWIHNSLKRDLKMIDTQIMAGLQNGTAFFASTTIFAIGGCFALLGATDKVDAIFRDLPFAFHGGRSAYELKVGGLIAIFGYSFFKFGWSYRLFNYCTILFGGLPMVDAARRDPAAAEAAGERVVAMNIEAARNFNAGLRAIFLSIGYLGWFIHAWVFMAMTVFVIATLIRRQYYSQARAVVLSAIEPEIAEERG